MSTNQEEVLGKITELTNQVKELAENHGGLSGWKAADAEATMRALLKEQQQAILDNMPARRGDPDPQEQGEQEKALSQYRGKYRREISDIVKHGEYKVGSYRLTGADLVFSKMLLDKANQMKAAGQSFKGLESVKPVSDDLNTAVKLLTSTGTGIGDELVPTGMAGELWQDFFAASRVASDLPVQPMPTDPFNIGLGFGQITFRKGTQGQSSSAQNPATDDSTLTSTELLAEINWTYDLDEDAVVAVMPALRQQIVVDGAETMDAFVLNADGTNAATGNINLDDANPPDDSYYLTAGQDGIRHLPIVDNTGQVNSGGGDALADADVISMLNDLDKYGLNLEQVRIVPGIATYFAMLGLTNVATVDKYGPMATIVRGELMRYRGVPVLPSASMPKTESDYKVSTTAGNNTLGQMVAYNRNFWRVGYRRGLLIEVDRNIQTRSLIMVVSFRMAIAAHGTRSSAKHTALVGNFTV